MVNRFRRDTARGHLGADVFGSGVVVAAWRRPRRGTAWPPSLQSTAQGYEKVITAARRRGMARGSLGGDGRGRATVRGLDEVDGRHRPSRPLPRPDQPPRPSSPRSPATVPPPLIAANRAELTQATQTNVFGQNNGMIAQFESQYGEMWAQDAAAMYGYAGVIGDGLAGHPVYRRG